MGWQIDYNTKVGIMKCTDIDLVMVDSNGFAVICRKSYSEYIPRFLVINDDHMKNLLGITPGHNNTFEGRLKKLILYQNKCRNWRQIEQLFRQAMPNLDIEITNG